MLRDNVYLGKNVITTDQDEQCTTFKMTNDTGEGIMKYYEVFSGIALLYNDFNMENCYSQLKTKEDMFAIEHCREGRIEWNMHNGKCLYLGTGDLRIDNRRNHTKSFEFPLGHYQGISILFYGKEAEESIKQALGGISLNLHDLKKKFCEKEEAFVIHAQHSIEHIFLQLYSVPREIKKEYFKIKILELLLYLSVIDVSGSVYKRPYFYKTQVEIIKSIERFITDNMENHYTLKELSNRFNISLTAMKTCFKGVYGISIYAYIRNYRMNRAARMLKETKDSVVSISAMVGYESHSKFSVAFKAVMGKTPLEYRKSIV